MNELVAKFFQALVLIAGLVWCGVCTAQCRILPQAPQQQQKHLPPCHQQQKQEQKSDCGAAYGDIAKDSVDTPAPDTICALEPPTPLLAYSSRLNHLPARWNPPQQGPPGAFSILRT